MLEKTEMKNQSGVTLVELLVVVTIMVMIIVPIVTITTLFYGQSQEVMTTNNLQQEARLITDYVTDFVHRQGNVNLTYNNGELSANGTPFLFWQGSRILKRDGVVLSEHILDTTSIQVVNEDNTQAVVLYLVLGDGVRQYETYSKVYIRSRTVTKTYEQP